MKLRELISKLDGGYELTIFVAHPSADMVPGGCYVVNYKEPAICGMEKANITKEEIWPDIKDARVTRLHLTDNRNYDGPALWVTIDK